MILEHAKITILGKFIWLPPLLLFAVGMKKDVTMINPTCSNHKHSKSQSRKLQIVTLLLLLVIWVLWLLTVVTSIHRIKTDHLTDTYQQTQNFSNLIFVFQTDKPKGDPLKMSVFRQGLFAGKVALVTGGGTGIGKAISNELLHLGRFVVYWS